MPSIRATVLADVPSLREGRAQARDRVGEDGGEPLGDAVGGAGQRPGPPRPVGVVEAEVGRQPRPRTDARSMLSPTTPTAAPGSTLELRLVDQRQAASRRRLQARRAARAEGVVGSARAAAGAVVLLTVYVLLSGLPMRPHRGRDVESRRSPCRGWSTDETTTRRAHASTSTSRRARTSAPAPIAASVSLRSTPMSIAPTMPSALGLARGRRGAADAVVRDDANVLVGVCAGRVRVDARVLGDARRGVGVDDRRGDRARDAGERPSSLPDVVKRADAPRCRRPAR